MFFPAMVLPMIEGLVSKPATMRIPCCSKPCSKKNVEIANRREMHQRCWSNLEFFNGINDFIHGEAESGRPTAPVIARSLRTTMGSRPNF